MLEIIDLSQEIFPGMPIFPGLPEAQITLHASHEQWGGITNSDLFDKQLQATIPNHTASPARTP